MVAQFAFDAQTTGLVALFTVLSVCAIFFRRRMFSYTVHRSVECEGSVKQVFLYLANFANVAEWDPNVKDARILSCRTKNMPPKAGDAFAVTTIFKGKESAMEYLLYEANTTTSRLVLLGMSDTVVARDVIVLSDAGSPQRPMTRVDYTLEIHLTGWREPFIRLIARDLEELGTQSIGGLVKACAARFGGSSKKSNGATSAAASGEVSKPAGKRASKSPAKRTPAKKQ